MAVTAVSWKSKKQGCVARSSVEAKYTALAAAPQEAFWLRKIFQLTTKGSPIPPTKILVDNQGAVILARTDSSASRPKHIGIQYHFVRDSLSKDLFAIDHIPTSDMTADMQTIPLAHVLQNVIRQFLA